MAENSKEEKGKEPTGKKTPGAGQTPKEEKAQTPKEEAKAPSEPKRTERSEQAAKADATLQTTIPSEADIPSDIIGGYGQVDLDSATTITYEPPESMALTRTYIPITHDLGLWIIITNSGELISFNRYKAFIDNIMCGNEPVYFVNPSDPEIRKTRETLRETRITPYPRVFDYNLFKASTELFLMTHCGVYLQEEILRIISAQILKDFPELSSDEYSEMKSIPGYGEEIIRVLKKPFWHEYLKKIMNGQDLQTLPYLELIRAKLHDIPIKSKDADICYGILQEKFTHPCFLELIWSYWHEEGMLCQTMNVISQRFQNRLDPKGRNPLAHLNIDPLRPLNSLLWGYIQDEQHRLNLPRRTYEYDHHYGIRLYGKAVPKLQPADSRSKFIEAFHNLLHLCTIFFRDDDDNTITADGYPILNALKEVHMLLAQGAHNQYGDLPWTARMEMLMQQWLLARPEMREFLGGRIMVPYTEPWMDRVDNVKTLMDWTNISITHFNYLAIFGEQILLSIRFGNWSTVNDRDQAANWTRLWRSQIQGYIHNYRAVTGKDLSSDAASGVIDSTMPSVHLRRRLQEQLAMSGKIKR